MFSQAALREGTGVVNRVTDLPVAINGLDARSPLASMDPRSAIVLDNFIAYPDRVELRAGCSNHVTGFTQPVQGLWSWNGPTGSTLFATCDNGVFDATAAGAVGAAVSAITEGYTQGVNINTGAANFLVLVNATDNLRHWNGAVWTIVAAFGGLNTNLISAIEVYKQRLFMIERDSMNLWYLPPNSIAGAATVYPLGAIFRRGGKLAAIGTWTVDGGTGPDDNFVVVSSEGEVAVFSGTDPSALATWAYRGVYYIGRPLGGARCLYKQGGDLLLLTERGLFPLAKALQSSTVDKRVALTDKVQALFAVYASIQPTSLSWCMLDQLDIPVLIVNIPGPAEGRQLVMNLQSGAWSTFSGWVANCFVRFGRQIFYGTGTSVVLALDGYSDFGNNIVGTQFQAYNKLGYARTKQIKMVRPLVTTSNPFDYTVGIADDFSVDPNTNIVSNPLSSFATWGISLWGASYWSGATVLLDWRTVPNPFGTWKAMYFQVASKTARLSLEAWNIVYKPGGTF